MHNPFDPGYFGSHELRAFGFARVGENCLIARNCTIIGLANITLGDNVRIDGFTSIIAPRGKLKLGSHIHIATACLLGARAGIEMEDFSSLSQGVRIFTAIDDYSGKHMTNSVVPAEVLGVFSAPVRIGRHVPIGSGSIVLPGVEIGEGASVGAMSLVPHPLKAWTMYAGNPAREIGPRSRDLLTLEPLALRGAEPDL